MQRRVETAKGTFEQVIFEMRFQILALTASLAASTFAGYLLAAPPTASPASPDRFAAVSNASQATIFTEFGNEMAWETASEDKDLAPADICAPLRDNTGNGHGLLEGLIHRTSQGGSEGRTEAVGKTACRAR